MTLLPASAEPATNAGTGPEGRKRSASVDSGASSDATIVVACIDWIDDADMGAVDARHKAVATEEALTSPPERPHKRAASDEDLAAHDAKRGRVSTDTASGAPALATRTNTAGSPTAAAPMSVSINTATALAVADTNADARNEHSEAPDGGHDEGTPAHSAPTAAAHDAAADAASSARPEVAIAPGTPAQASSTIVEHHDLAPASASTTTAVDSALGAAASKSDTIVANETSRGDAGCPQTPVISRTRSHAVAIRPFAIGRTSTPAPAPQAGGSKSAVLVANATSRVHANCPSTPVVSRLSVPRSHAIVGGAVHAFPVAQISALRVGRRSSGASTATPAASPTPATPTAVPPALATAPTVPLMPATATSPRFQPQSSAERFSVLRTVSWAIRRGMDAIQNALIVLRNRGIRPTNEHRLTSPGPLANSNGYGRAERDRARWDEDAAVDPGLLELFRRERRRFL